jgi:hypothetical protein
MQGEIEDSPGEVDRHREDEDGPWYFGKAKEEFHRRRGQGRMSQIEEDPIKVLFCSTEYFKLFTLRSIS